VLSIVVVTTPVDAAGRTVTVVRPAAAPPTPPALLTVDTGISIVRPLLMTTSLLAVAGQDIVSHALPF